MGPGASAPGKVMLAGEYAVLEGADAVVMAVNRRVVAYLSDPPPARPGPFLRAVCRVVAEHAGAHSIPARAAAHVTVDSTALRAGRAKLGLGSSAAVTVAACACALAQSQRTIAGAGAPGESVVGAGAESEAGDEDIIGPVDSGMVHRLAHAAHGQAQARRGARGSGADIAASVYGGIVAVRARSDTERARSDIERGRATSTEPVLVRPLGTGSAHLVFLWTGTAASTPALVSRIQAWRRTEPGAYDRALAAIADAASQVITALRPSARPEELVSAVAAGGRAVAELGQRAGVALETPAHREIAALAREHGQGAVKPTGAGGGDIALAAFATAEQAAGFRREASARGLYVLDLAIDPHGVAVSPARAPAPDRQIDPP